MLLHDQNKVISLTTEEGNRYLLQFIYHDILNNHSPVPVVEIVLVLASDKLVTNSVKSLMLISDLAYEYLDHAAEDTLLYFYCTTQKFSKERKRKILPQEYRYKLFKTLCLRRVNRSNKYLFKDIVVEDEVNGSHFIGIISRKENKKIIYKFIALLKGEDNCKNLHARVSTSTLVERKISKQKTD